jgi:hypothetical protein
MWQERSLVLNLRLGGYEPHVAKNCQEVINLVKLLEDAVHSIVLPATGNQCVLSERLAAFSEHQVTPSIILLGISEQDLRQNHNLGDHRDGVKLTACWVEQLLD